VDGELFVLQVNAGYHTGQEVMTEMNGWWRVHAIAGCQVPVLIDRWLCLHHYCSHNVLTTAHFVSTIHFTSITACFDITTCIAVTGDIASIARSPYHLPLGLPLTAWLATYHLACHLPLALPSPFWWLYNSRFLNLYLLSDLDHRLKFTG